MRESRAVWALLALGLGACSSQAPNQGNPFLNLNAGGAAGTTPTAMAGSTNGGTVETGAAGSTTTTMAGAGTGGSVAGDASVAGGGAAPGSGGSAGSGGAAGSGGGVGGTAAGGAGSRLPAVPDGRGIYGHPDPNTDYPKYDGFTPYLIEEFNAPIDLDRDPIWTWSDTSLGDGAARMVKDNIGFKDGNMVLSVTQTPQPGGYSFAAADNVADRSLSSGEFRTLYNNFRYGRYEVRMKAPPAAANYIFTMFAYRTPAYLNWREIDVEVQASPQNSFITNLITAGPGTRTWNGGIEESARQYPFGGDAAAGPVPAGFDTQADFHVYAFEWLPTSVKWYVDGKLIRSKLDGAGKNSLPIPKLSTKIVMNLWIFPTKDLGGGDPALNVYPIAGQYDWFRFYRWNTEDTYPCANTPSCLSADDLKLAKNNVNDPYPDVRPEMCTGIDGMLDVACGP
jgi:endo-1,3-1,4-beta-glycanase ExoK